MRNISICFYIVSTVKNFRLQQQSVRNKENVVIHRAYWWKQFLWMNECWQWATTALRRLYSECRPVKPMHNNMDNIHCDRYCTTMKMEYWAWWLLNTKPVIMESCQPCTVLWMAEDTATNVYEILFTHKVQFTENGISNTSIHTVRRSKLHIKWHISFYYNIYHTSATWWYP
jgi:hypothetical protein